MGRNMIDLTGKTFGKLFVIKIAYRDDKKKNIMWLCECQNEGNKIIVQSGNLLNGNTTSCGCYRSEVLSQRRFKDLTGKKFNLLKVIKLDHMDSFQGSYWLCECSNEGNQVIVRGKNLTNGHTISCGCVIESKIATDLKQYYIKNYKAQTEFKIFKNPETGHYLPYDIYLPNYNIFIEIHGEQHYIFKKYFHKTKKGFKYCKKLDKIKMEYAKKNGVYIEIDLRKIKTTKIAIKYINNILEKIAR